MNTPPPQPAAELPVAPVLLLHKVRAFTDQPQGGNPAGVICFAQFPPEVKLQQLAQQAKQPVTAMLAPVEGGYQIHWFTPQQEINLCGHGTLAAAAVLFAQTPEMSQVAFSVVMVISRFAKLPKVLASVYPYLRSRQWHQRRCLQLLVRARLWRQPVVVI